MQGYALPPFSFIDDIRHYSRFIIASVVIHLICFFILIISPHIKSRSHYTPTVINVDLVSIPTPGPQGNGQPRVKQVSRPKPKAKAVVVTKSTAVKKSAPANPKVKRSLKKKTFKPSEVINEAIRNVKNSVDTSQEEALKKAMANIAREVESEDAASANQRYGTGYAGYGRTGADMLSIYKAEIFSIIQRNWSFSEHLAGNRTDIAVKLAIKIMPDGEIREIWFDERSGNSYLDESAQKAVLKSNPLPPLPKGFNKPFLNQGFRFTPLGLDR